MPKILARYVIREVLGPFVVILVVATFVLLMHRLVRLTDLIVNKGVPALDVLLLIAYIMPRFLAFTIPVAILLAVMIAFGRLNGDSEIIALKASGVSLAALLAPALGLAAVLAATTAYFTLYALPGGNRAVENLLFELARTRATVAITPGVFSNEFSRFVLYVEAVDDRAGELRGVVLHDAASLDQPFAVFARRGRIYDDESRKRLFLRLEEGEVHLGRPGERRHDVLGFEVYDVDLSLGGALELRPESERGVEEYTLAELRATIARAESEGAYPGEALVEFHRRFALPFVCIVFTILGVPLAVGPPRSGRSAGFIIGLVVTTAFFLMLRGAETLGVEGKVPAWLAMWSPHLVLGPGAIYLFRLAARERRFAPLDWFDRASERIAALLRREGRAA